MQLFCGAIEDRNPVYWDERIATKSRFGRIIAPPQFLMAANVPPPWLPDYLKDDFDRESSTNSEAQARAILAEYGFTTVTVVNRVDEYLEPFGPGDGRIRRERRVTSISPIKETKVGRGVFFTYETEFFRESDGEQIGRSRNVTLIYRPKESE